MNDAFSTQFHRIYHRIRYDCAATSYGPDGIKMTLTSCRRGFVGNFCGSEVFQFFEKLLVEDQMAGAAGVKGWQEIFWSVRPVTDKRWRIQDRPGDVAKHRTVAWRTLIRQHGALVRTDMTKFAPVSARASRGNTGANWPVTRDDCSAGPRALWERQHICHHPFRVCDDRASRLFAQPAIAVRAKWRKYIAFR
jgi:hypothetical protein